MSQGRKPQCGFTLTETIMVVAVIAILAVASVPAYLNFHRKYQIDVASHDTLQLLRIAQSNAMASQGHDEYGMNITTGAGGSIEIFKGSDYVSRDTSFEGELITFPNTVTISDTIADPDVVFLRIEGSTTDTGTMTLSNGTNTKTITVYETGLVELD